MKYEPVSYTHLDVYKRQLQTHPVSEQLLSMTIKDLKKDEQGNIIGATFAFDTLSRIGKCTLKDITLEGKKIDKIGEIFKWWATYIDNINDPQDYSHTISRLQSQFSDGKRKKDYLWSSIGQLDFDGKVFKKWKENITRFLTTEKAADSKNQKEKTFDVEYKVCLLYTSRCV